MSCADQYAGLEQRRPRVWDSACVWWEASPGSSRAHPARTPAISLIHLPFCCFPNPFYLASALDFNPLLIKYLSTQILHSKLLPSLFTVTDLAWREDLHLYRHSSPFHCLLLELGTPPPQHRICLPRSSWDNVQSLNPTSLQCWLRQTTPFLLKCPLILQDVCLSKILIFALYSDTNLKIFYLCTSLSA